MTSTAGVSASDYVTGTGIAANAKVVTVDSSTNITVDKANSGAVSGILIFRHYPSETLPTASNGFKMKWKIKTNTDNATAITSLYMPTVSNDVSQGFQYPLDTQTLTINIVDSDGNSITQNCEVTIVRTSDETVLFSEESVTDGSTSYTYETSGITCYINVLNVAGYQPKTINNYVLSSDDSSLTIQLDEDRYYNNP
jgi:hypothetical protein